MNKLQEINKIFQKINHYTFQYVDGQFARVSSFKKIKDKPNKLYEFNLSIRYCKCCNVLYSIHFDIGKNHYYWSCDTENQNNDDVNFQENISFVCMSFDEILKIIKENIDV